MTKAIWMSDPHLTAQGNLRGLNCRTRLAAAVAHINEHQADAEFCMITGDLVNDETAADYASLKSHLAELHMTYYPMMGNDDDRDLLRAALPLPDNCMAEFIQYSVATKDGLMICLDTHKAGAVEGEFCTQRLKWLRDTLDDAGDVPVFIFMHHPPMDLGIDIMDEIRNKDGEVLLDLIQDYKNVRQLFIGHIHRAIAGTVRGIPYSIISAISFQAPQPVPTWDWSNFTPAQEAPAYGVCNFANGDVNIHYIQFCKYELGME